MSGQGEELIGQGKRDRGLVKYGVNQVASQLQGQLTAVRGHTGSNENYDPHSLLLATRSPIVVSLPITGVS